MLNSDGVFLYSMEVTLSYLCHPVLLGHRLLYLAVSGSNEVSMVIFGMIWSLAALM
jgi:hypothetical protein